jgi:hypothetical protein
VDPKKVPTGGIHARCSVCSDVFLVSVPEPEAEPVEAETPKDFVEEAEAPEVSEVEAEVPEDFAEEAEAPEVSEVEAETPEDFAEGAEAPEVSEVEAETPEDFAQEAEVSFGEGEVTFGEGEVTFEEVEAPFEEAEEPFEETEAPFEEATDEVMEAVEEEPEGPSVSAPLFGKRDPIEKAQRLARVLVSDIILYNPDRHHNATESGRVKEEFEEEIQKSWNEYVEQVGEEMANSTNFFNDALNEILAKGEQLF